MSAVTAPAAESAKCCFRPVRRCVGAVAHPLPQWIPRIKPVGVGRELLTFSAHWRLAHSIEDLAGVEPGPGEFHQWTKRSFRKNIRRQTGKWIRPAGWTPRTSTAPNPGLPRMLAFGAQHQVERHHRGRVHGSTPSPRSSVLRYWKTGRASWWLPVWSRSDSRVARG